MNNTTLIITKLFALFTIFGDGAIFLGIAYFILYSLGVARMWTEKIGAWCARYSLPIAFITALSATMGSFYYSEVAGFAPCGLCWFQRIFMYPQVILFGMALRNKDRRVVDYALALSIFGGIVAAYHSYIQFGGSALIPCPLVQTATSCAQRFIFEFGYVTFPIMGFTAFALIIIAMCFYKKFGQDQSAL